MYGGAGVHVGELARELRRLADVDGALLRPAAQPGATAHPVPAGFEDANPALQTLARRPGDGRGLGRQRRPALAHLVRQPRRAGRRAAARSAARADGALARAEPAVEGRAARRRLPRLVVGGAHGLPGRPAAVIAVSDRHAGRHPRRPTRSSTRSACTSYATASTPCSTRPSPRPSSSRLRHRPQPAVRRVRRADHPSEGHARTCCARPRVRGRRPAGAVRRRAGHPGDRRRDRRAGPRAAGLARRRRLDPGACAPRRPCCSCSPTRWRSCARRCTSRSASSTSRRWPARRRSSRRDVGGIPEVVADGETGLLVPFDEAEPRAFEFAFADAVNTLVADPHRATALGARGRARAVRALRLGPGRRAHPRRVRVSDPRPVRFVSRDKGPRSLPAPDSAITEVGGASGMSVVAPSVGRRSATVGYLLYLPAALMFALNGTVSKQLLVGGVDCAAAHTAACHGAPCSCCSSSSLLSRPKTLRLQRSELPRC